MHRRTITSSVNPFGRKLASQDNSVAAMSQRVRLLETRVQQLEQSRQPARRRKPSPNDSSASNASLQNHSELRPEREVRSLMIPLRPPRRYRRPAQVRLQPDPNRWAAQLQLQWTILKPFTSPLGPVTVGSTLCRSIGMERFGKVSS